jgi:hypothetical protein
MGSHGKQEVNSSLVLRTSRYEWRGQPDLEQLISDHDTATFLIDEGSRKKSMRCIAMGYNSLETGILILREFHHHLPPMYVAFAKQLRNPSII